MKLKEAQSLLSLDGVDMETITKKEVMKAFREKSRFMHPDKHKGASGLPANARVVEGVWCHTEGRVEDRWRVAVARVAIRSGSGCGRPATPRGDGARGTGAVVLPGATLYFRHSIPYLL